MFVDAGYLCAGTGGLLFATRDPSSRPGQSRLAGTAQGMLITGSFQNRLDEEAPAHRTPVADLAGLALGVVAADELGPAAPVGGLHEQRPAPGVAGQQLGPVLLHPLLTFGPRPKGRLRMTTIRTLAAGLVAAAAVFAVGAAAGAAVIVFADISGYEHEAEIRLANSKGHDLMAIASVGRIATRGAAQSAVRCTCRPAPGCWPRQSGRSWLATG